MSRRTGWCRRRAAAVVAGVVAAAVGATVGTTVGTAAGSTAAERRAATAVTTPAPAAAAEGEGAEGTRYRFVSTPDFMNGDVADLRRYAGWQRARRQHGRVPNSWNPAYARMVDVVLDRLRAERPDDVLVAGDLVNGHWTLDRHGTGIFGPVATRRQKMRAIHRAATVYFSAYDRLFRDRGLTLRPAVGDHEYGDDPWRGTRRDAPVKRAAMGIVRERFDRVLLRRHGYTARPDGPTRRTAYATYLHPEVLLVSLDMFQRRADDIVGQLDDAQLDWLEEVLTVANLRDTDWIVVQGHLPVVPNVRTAGSSGMCYVGGRRSALWRTLVDHEVDLYLNGEVHDVTAHHVDGVTQVSHGGVLGMSLDDSRGNTSYLVGDVVGERLDLRAMRFVTQSVDRSRHLWQTARRGSPVRSKVLHPVPELLGTMTLTEDQELLSRDGRLAAYDGPVRCRTGGERPG